MLTQNDLQVKHFFEQNNRFKSLHCQNNYGQWLLRSSNFVVQHPDRYVQIQINSQNLTQALAFDIDHEDPFVWQDYNLPYPSIVTINKNNGKSHILYYLKAPVSVGSAKEFMLDICESITITLGADLAYNMRTTKNYMNTDQFHMFGKMQTYALNDFTNYMIKHPALPIQCRKSAFGRNCALFDSVRFYAYKAKLDFSSFEHFKKHIYDTAIQTNIKQFETPLGYKEVKDVAKSVAVWTWENDVPGVWNWDGYEKKTQEVVSKMFDALALCLRDNPSLK